MIASAWKWVLWFTKVVWMILIFRVVFEFVGFWNCFLFVLIIYSSFIRINIIIIINPPLYRINTINIVLLLKSKTSYLFIIHHHRVSLRFFLLNNYTKRRLWMMLCLCFINWNISFCFHLSFAVVLCSVFQGSSSFYRTKEEEDRRKKKEEERKKKKK